MSVMKKIIYNMNMQRIVLHNYKSLYAVINMTIETDNEHIHTYIYEHIHISSSSSSSSSSSLSFLIYDKVTHITITTIITIKS